MSQEVNFKQTICRGPEKWLSGYEHPRDNRQFVSYTHNCVYPCVLTTTMNSISVLIKPKTLQSLGNLSMQQESKGYVYILLFLVPHKIPDT